MLKMTSIYNRVKSGDATQRAVAKELLLRNLGKVPCCCFSMRNGVASCERYEALTTHLCIQCQREMLRELE